MESKFWAYVRHGMLGKWHATRIESYAGNGVPDVTFGISNHNGWLELKYIPTWPKRPTTKVKLPLRPEQRYWIKARGEVAGCVWVLCRIQDHFLLVPWWRCQDSLTQAEWLSAADVRWWHRRIDFEELAQALSESAR